MDSGRNPVAQTSDCRPSRFARQVDTVRTCSRIRAIRRRRSRRADANGEDPRPGGSRRRRFWSPPRTSRTWWFPRRWRSAAHPKTLRLSAALPTRLPATPACRRLRPLCTSEITVISSASTSTQPNATVDRRRARPREEGRLAPTGPAGRCRRPSGNALRPVAASGTLRPDVPRYSVAVEPSREIPGQNGFSRARR